MTDLPHGIGLLRVGHSSTLVSSVSDAEAHYDVFRCSATRLDSETGESLGRMHANQMKGVPLEATPSSPLVCYDYAHDELKLAILGFDGTVSYRTIAFASLRRLGQDGDTLLLVGPRSINAVSLETTNVLWEAERTSVEDEPRTTSQFASLPTVQRSDDGWIIPCDGQSCIHAPDGGQLLYRRGLTFTMGRRYVLGQNATHRFTVDRGQLRAEPRDSLEGWTSEAPPGLGHDAYQATFNDSWIVLQATERITVYESRTGRTVWGVDCNRHCPWPLLSGDHLLLSEGGDSWLRDVELPTGRQTRIGRTGFRYTGVHERGFPIGAPIHLIVPLEDGALVSQGKTLIRFARADGNQRRP